jgi:hypothetical protein
MEVRGEVDRGCSVVLLPRPPATFFDAFGIGEWMEWGLNDREQEPRRIFYTDRWTRWESRGAVPALGAGAMKVTPPSERLLTPDLARRVLTSSGRGRRRDQS